MINITSSNRDSDVYKLLNIIHVMAGRCAVQDIEGWVLGVTATYEDYSKTVWSNGTVDVTAITYPHMPKEEQHTYSISNCIK